MWLTAEVQVGVGQRQGCSDSASLAWMMGGDEGVPTDPRIWDGAGMEPGWPRTPSVAKFHLPLSRTKLLI